ncbi:MAG: dipeptidase [Acidobacteriota bacterium]|nr:dipeptidase [Acidobacteriota bacterium]
MKEKKLCVFTFILFISSLLMVSCTGQQNQEDLTVKAREIHDRVLTVDTHCDTPMRMVGSEWDVGQRHEPGQRRSGKIDLPRMMEGGLDAEFFAAFVGQGALTPEGRTKAKERADLLIDAVHKMCEDYPDIVGFADSPDDAYRLEKEGKCAAFIGMENGYPVGKDISLVEKFYKRGVRYITLSHSSDNDICDSSTDRSNPEDNGLSDFGRKVVAECNRLGIMVDISHVSDKSFFDVLEITKAPVIASHSSVRAICDHPRNLSDEMLKALTVNNGVIQICLVSSFVKESEPNPEREKAVDALTQKYGTWRDIKDENLQQKVRQEYREIFEKYPEEKATLKDLADHIDYVVKLIGVNHVGIGTDFDGGGGVEGCDDVSEMPNITEELLRRGYLEEDIRKIWGGNLMRVFGRVIEVSEEIQNSK